MSILREAVVSSNIAAIGYKTTERKLEVAFRPNRSGQAAVWEYDEVDAVTAAGLLNADSVGRAFAMIRRNYTGRQVGTIDAAGVEHRLDAVAESA